MPETETNEKPKSRAEQMLEAVETAIENYVVGGGQRTTTIGGVSFQYTSISDLLRLKTYYENEVRKEKGARIYRIRAVMPC